MFILECGMENSDQSELRAKSRDSSCGSGYACHLRGRKFESQLIQQIFYYGMLRIVACFMVWLLWLDIAID